MSKDIWVTKVQFRQAMGLVIKYTLIFLCESPVVAAASGTIGESAVLIPCFQHSINLSFTACVSSVLPIELWFVNFFLNTSLIKKLPVTSTHLSCFKLSWENTKTSQLVTILLMTVAMYWEHGIQAFLVTYEKYCLHKEMFKVVYWILRFGSKPDLNSILPVILSNWNQYNFYVFSVKVAPNYTYANGKFRKKACCHIVLALNVAM